MPPYAIYMYIWLSSRTDLRSKWRGPSSLKYPSSELQPGPPFCIYNYTRIMVLHYDSDIYNRLPAKVQQDRLQDFACSQQTCVRSKSLKSRYERYLYSLFRYPFWAPTSNGGICQYLRQSWCSHCTVLTGVAYPIPGDCVPHRSQWPLHRGTPSTVEAVQVAWTWRRTDSQPSLMAIRH